MSDEDDEVVVYSASDEGEEPSFMKTDLPTNDRIQPATNVRRKLGPPINNWTERRRKMLV